MKSRFRQIRLRYQFTVLAQLLLLAASIGALLYMALGAQLFAVSLVFALLLVGQIATLLAGLTHLDEQSLQHVRAILATRHGA